MSTTTSARRRATPGGTTTSTARPGKAARPAAAAVNLISPWVVEDLRVHQLRRRFLLAGVVLLVAIALVWSALRFNLHRANEDLRGEEAVTAGLTTKLADLAPVRAYVDGVDRRLVTITGATYDDVAFSRVLEALDLALPDAAGLTSMSVELAAAETGTGAAGTRSPEDRSRGLVGTTCPGPDPFGTKVVVGCVTLSGTAPSREVVGSFVIALGAEKLFVEPFIDTTTTGEQEGDAVTFSGSVGLSPAVFSGRYDTLGDELTKGASK